MKKAIMCVKNKPKDASGVKHEPDNPLFTRPTKKPIDVDLHVVVVANGRLQTIVVGYFATAEAAERFAARENSKRPTWTYLAMRLTTVREYRAARYKA